MLYNPDVASPLPHSADEPLIAPLCSIFRRFLKRQGLKFTLERALILNAVLDKEGIFEAEQLVAEMRQATTRVSKATIYRTIKHLLDAGIITEVLLDSRQAHYQLAFGRTPNGHLVCVETKRVVEFPLGDEIAELRDRVCKQHGFDPVTARVIIYGISPEAQQAAQAEEAEND